MQRTAMHSQSAKRCCGTLVTALLRVFQRGGWRAGHGATLGDTCIGSVKLSNVL
jgi:hypothetical protein